MAASMPLGLLSAVAVRVLGLLRDYATYRNTTGGSGVTNMLACVEPTGGSFAPARKVPISQTLNATTVHPPVG